MGRIGSNGVAPSAGPPAPGVLRLVPLGGLGEVGMNCLCLEQEEGIVIIDCGITFPTTDLGIDVYHPRFDWLEARSERVLGLVLTHGHEDHIGAIPYLLDRLDMPIYGPPHALELVRLRLTEHEIDLGEVDLITTKPRTPFTLGPFTFEPIRVTHSITDATALAIRTAAGTIVHTGDFKLDPTPPDGELTDELRLETLGDEGVRLLLSDSTNIDSPGSAASEATVGEALEAIARRSKHRLVIGMFSSNVQRLRLIGAIAQRTGRKICLLGRSVGTHTRAAHTISRLAWPSDLVISPDVAMQMPRDKVLIIASGTQGERGAALPRLAAGTHHLMRLDAGDTVVLSSRIIPGNDRVVFDLMSSLLRMGIDLVTRVTDRHIHASGHAHRDEQLRMIQLTRPRSFMPVHGTLHHLMRHAELAKDAGVADMIVVENGDTVEIEADAPLRKSGRVGVGKVATSNREELSEDVLRERATLGRGGVLFVALALDRRGALTSPPEIIQRGIAHLDQVATKHVSQAVARAVSELSHVAREDDTSVMETARSAARRTAEAETGGRPMVTVAVLRS